MIYKTIGYNRWPRQWDPSVPLWQRYPNEAPMQAAWPPEMIGTLFSGSEHDGHVFPLTVVMLFTNLDEQTMVFRVFPSVVRSGTATRIARTVLGERNEPEEIFSSIDYIGPDALNWETAIDRVIFDRPYQFDVNYQRSSLVFDIIAADPAGVPVAEYRFNTTSAGREIELPDEL